MREMVSPIDVGNGCVSINGLLVLGSADGSRQQGLLGNMLRLRWRLRGLRFGRRPHRPLERGVQLQNSYIQDPTSRPDYIEATPSAPTDSYQASRSTRGSSHFRVL